MGDSADIDDVGEVLEPGTDSVETPTPSEEGSDETSIFSEGDSDTLEADATDEEAETFETLDEIAEATGMDTETFLRTIKARTKVNGQESEKSLADIIKGYQLESDYTRKNEAFIQKQKQWEEAQVQAQAKLQHDLQQTGALFQRAQQELTREYNGINWEQLKADDPQQFMLKRQELGERQAQLDHLINNATHHAQQVMQQQEAQKQQRLAEYTKAQDQLLLKALPDWKKPEVRERESREITQFLLDNGYSPQEVGSIVDHRVILMARNAMKGIDNITKADLAEKKVRAAPKLVKPGPKRNRSKTPESLEEIFYGTD